MNLIPLRNDYLFPLEQTFDKFFNDFFRDKSNINTVKGSGGYPKLNAYLENDAFKMVFSVPGVHQDDLEVEYNDDHTISVKGKMSSKYQSTTNESNYFVRELRQSYFQRVLTLPESIEGEPEASLSDGLLTLTWKIKKLEEKSKKRITIKSESPP